MCMFSTIAPLSFLLPHHSFLHLPSEPYANKKRAVIKLEKKESGKEDVDKTIMVKSANSALPAFRVLSFMGMQMKYCRLITSVKTLH